MKNKAESKQAGGANRKPEHKGAGHRQRLREKFLSSGLAGFHDYEVVELLLTLATPRKDCKDAAKLAMKQFKSLQGVLDASPGALREIPGIGPKNLLGIKLIKAVADRYLEGRLIGEDPMKNSEKLYEFLYHQIRAQPRECLVAVFLDAKNHVLATETIASGSLTVSSIHPREVAASALENNAAAVLFAHNHPSGEIEPSPDDRTITRKLIFACRVLGVTVHDHLIIGNNEFYSFADHGEITRLNREYEEKMEEV